MGEQPNTSCIICLNDITVPLSYRPLSNMRALFWFSLPICFPFVAKFRILFFYSNIQVTHLFTLFVGRSQLKKIDKVTFQFIVLMRLKTSILLQYLYLEHYDTFPPTSFQHPPPSFTSSIFGKLEAELRWE